jgi:hypothetical protein
MLGPGSSLFWFSRVRVVLDFKISTTNFRAKSERNTFRSKILKRTISFIYTNSFFLFLWHPASSGIVDCTSALKRFLETYHFWQIVLNAKNFSEGNLQKVDSWLPSESRVFQKLCFDVSCRRSNHHHWWIEIEIILIIGHPSSYIQKPISAK